MADGSQFVELQLAPALTSPKHARVWAAEVLIDWDLTSWLDDVQSLITELVANAVLHARTTMMVRLSCQDAQLRIAVIDTSPTMPRVDLDALSVHTTGRGLLLIDELADEWGIDPVGGGKSVWCMLRLDPAVSP